MLTVIVVTDPSGVRVSVNGDILALKEPRSAWARHFGQALPVSFPDMVALKERPLIPF